MHQYTAVNMITILRIIGEQGSSAYPALISDMTGIPYEGVRKVTFFAEQEGYVISHRVKVDGRVRTTFELTGKEFVAPVLKKKSRARIKTEAEMNEYRARMAEKMRMVHARGDRANPKGGRIKVEMKIPSIDPLMAAFFGRPVNV